ncbi:MAG: DNA repair protein RecO [Candidatus Omnitrophica bacterium]|nr:DNA repair protein RecO [Candidatus Omnitrophota bacterium]
MAIVKTDGIVLHRADYRETSFLVRLMTADYGRICVQAKGARRQKGKFGSSFLAGSRNTVVFYENAHAALHILSQADMAEPFARISCSLDRFSYAAYFLELVDSVLPWDEPNRSVYDLLHNCLHFLDQADIIEGILPLFEVKFLSLSGFKPRLDSCVHCSRIIDDESRFSYRFGGLLCARCYDNDAQAHAILKGTIASVNHLESIPVDRIGIFRMDGPIRAQMCRLLRDFIDFHFGRQFRSLQFLNKVRFAYA